jgi:hypothetical protein
MWEKMNPQRNRNGRLEDRERDVKVALSWDLRELDFDDGKWMDLIQNFVQWRVFLLAPLKLWVLLSEF